MILLHFQKVEQVLPFQELGRLLPQFLSHYQLDCIPLFIEFHAFHSLIIFSICIYVMKIITIVVTRSKSCHVKALHTILRLNIQCLERHVQNEITFCNDDPYEKADIILSCMKKCDRLLFIDFEFIHYCDFHH